MKTFMVIPRLNFFLNWQQSSIIRLMQTFCDIFCKIFIEVSKVYFVFLLLIQTFNYNQVSHKSLEKWFCQNKHWSTFKNLLSLLWIMNFLQESITSFNISKEASGEKKNDIFFKIYFNDFAVGQQNLLSNCKCKRCNIMELWLEVVTLENLSALDRLVAIHAKTLFSGSNKFRIRMIH